jgi:hypothetical protein
LDTVFFAIHLAMSAVHKRVLVTAREQLVGDNRVSVAAM